MLIIYFTTQTAQGSTQHYLLNNVMHSIVEQYNKENETNFSLTLLNDPSTFGISAMGLYDENKGGRLMEYIRFTSENGILTHFKTENGTETNISEEVKSIYQKFQKNESKFKSLKSQDHQGLKELMNSIILASSKDLNIISEKLKTNLTQTNLENASLKQNQSSTRSISSIIDMTISLFVLLVIVAVVLSISLILGSIVYALVLVLEAVIATTLGAIIVGALVIIGIGIGLEGLGKKLFEKGEKSYRNENSNINSDQLSLHYE